MATVDEMAARAVDEIDERGQPSLHVRNELLRRVLDLVPWQRRTFFMGALGLLCAEKAWPLWLEKFPEEDAPITFLKRAVGAAAQGSLIPDGHRELSNVKALIEGVAMVDDKKFRATYAGLSCWSASTDIIYGRHEYLTLGDSEREIDPDDWDGSFYASLALAGGASWEGVGDVARRDFWTWFFRTAIPDAFALAAHKDDQL
jgi:hypothetical protein